MNTNVPASSSWPADQPRGYRGVPTAEEIDRIAIVANRQTREATAIARENWRDHFRKQRSGYFGVRLGDPYDYVVLAHSPTPAVADCAYFDPETHSIIRYLLPIEAQGGVYEELRTGRDRYSRGLFLSAEKRWADGWPGVVRDEFPLRVRRAGR